MITIGRYHWRIINGTTDLYLVYIDQVLNNWADQIEKGDWGSTRERGD